jgi:GTP-binding protein
VLDAADNPDAAFKTVRGEIAAFDPVLSERLALVALNKIDLIDKAEVQKIARKLRKLTGLEVFPISADKRENLAPLVAAIARMLHTIDQPAVCPS